MFSCLRMFSISDFMVEFLYSVYRLMALGQKSLSGASQVCSVVLVQNDEKLCLLRVDELVPAYCFTCVARLLCLPRNRYREDSLSLTIQRGLGLKGLLS